MTTPGDEERPLAPETLAVHGPVDPSTRALVPPVHPSTTFARDEHGRLRDGRGYARSDNPTYDHPESLLTALEGGAASLLFASGQAAASAAFAALEPGAHVVVGRTLYWGLRLWLARFGVGWGLDVELVDTSDVAAVARAVVRGRTRLVWVETPANPTLEVTDLGAVAAVAHRAGARLAVDSTLASPVLTRPLEHGADLVVHSASKYLNGHSDVVAGAVVGAREDPFFERVREWRRSAGSVLGSFEAWLLLRGMRTLFPRVERSAATALAVARHLDGHPLVAQVLYPGLPGHSGHHVACRQMRGGFGGVLSLRVAGGEEAAAATARAVRVIRPATSLGGVESLIEHRAPTEGRSSSVPPDLLRLSVGLEHPDDLVDDLEQALAAAAAGRRRAPRPPETARSATVDEAVREVVDRVRPAVVARGGDLAVVTHQGGTVTLAVSGSPAATWPVRGEVTRRLRALPAVEEVVLVAGDGGAACGEEAGPGGDVVAAVEAVVEREVRPAVAAHGGGVEVRAVDDGVVTLALTGRCQGCSLAEVTVRQGIEPLLRSRVPAIEGLVDVTDHAAATDPYFSSSKR